MADLAIQMRTDSFAMAKLAELWRRFPAKYPDAVKDALNKSMDKRFTQTKRIIAANLGVTQNTLTTRHRFGGVETRDGRTSGVALRKMPATKADLTASVVYSGGRIPLIWFNAKMRPGSGKNAGLKRGAASRLKFAKTGGSMPRGAGVDYRIGSYSGGYIKRAFFAQMKSGHIGVFVRIPGSKRLPVSQPMGPSVPHIAEKNRDVQAQLDQLPNDFITQLQSQLDRFAALAAQKEARRAG